MWTFFVLFFSKLVDFYAGVRSLVRILGGAELGFRRLGG